MAKKPNSWKEINDLTQSVTLAKKSRKIKPIIITISSVLGVVLFSYLAFMLVSSVLSYGGINTGGNNPKVRDNNYIVVDFAKAPMHDLINSEWSNQTSDDINDHLHLQRDNSGNLLGVSSTSLRLEYFYNQLIENVPFFVTNNTIYKIFYPDSNLINVVNVYNDLKSKTLVSENGVAKNHYNVEEFNLYVQISYNNKPQSAFIIVPVQLIGLDDFYGNFFKFKLGDFIKKDNENATIWDQQTNMFGAMGSTLAFNKTSFAQDNFSDSVYSQFQNIFTNFFTFYQTTEFYSRLDNNPYDNFVISDVRSKDTFSDLMDPIDDNDYLLDLNSFTNLKAINFKDDDPTDGLSSLLIFLKNIIPYTQKDADLVASNDWDIKNLASIFSTPDYQTFINTLNPITNLQPEDQLYLMFMPQGFQLNNFINSALMKKLAQIIEDKENLKDFLTQVTKNLLISSDDPISKEISQWNILPFENYDITNTKDFNGSDKLQWLYEKYRIEANNSLLNVSSYLTIDRPTLYKLVPIQETYDLADPQDCYNLINNFLSTISYANLRENDVTIIWGDSQDDLNRKFFAAMTSIINNLLTYCTTNNIKILHDDEKQNLLLKKDNYNFTSYVYSRITKKTMNLSTWEDNVSLQANKEATEKFSTIDYNFTNKVDPEDNTNNNFIFRFFVKYQEI